VWYISLSETHQVQNLKLIQDVTRQEQGEYPDPTILGK